jgi:hypothetical protein
MKSSAQYWILTVVDENRKVGIPIYILSESSKEKAIETAERLTLETSSRHIIRVVNESIIWDSKERM